MKLIMAAALIAVLTACMSPSPKTEEAPAVAKASDNGPVRDIASMKKISRDSGQCVTNFNRGRDLAVKAIKANPKSYPDILVNDLDKLVKWVRVACVNQTISPFGFQVYPEDNYLFLDESLRNIHRLTEGPIGRLNTNKYQVVGRLITLDHLMAGIAVHTYAEIVGLDDSQYDLFYQIMKETSQPR